jgi:hypothetical protein
VSEVCADRGAAYSGQPQGGCILRTHNLEHMFRFGTGHSRTCRGITRDIFLGHAVA